MEKKKHPECEMSPQWCKKKKCNNLGNGWTIIKTELLS